MNEEFFDGLTGYLATLSWLDPGGSPVPYGAAGGRSRHAFTPLNDDPVHAAPATRVARNMVDTI